MTDSPSILISGPMTGLPDYNYPAFFHAEDQLRALGYKVYNPARIEGDHDTWEWADWMRGSLDMLVQCNAVAFLPGWERSRGARLEAHVADSLDMEQRTLHDWLEVAA